MFLQYEFHGKINTAWRAFRLAHDWQGRVGKASGKAGPDDLTVADSEWELTCTDQGYWRAEANATRSWRADRKAPERMNGISALDYLKRFFAKLSSDEGITRTFCRWLSESILTNFKNQHQFLIYLRGNRWKAAFPMQHVKIGRLLINW